MCLSNMKQDECDNTNDSSVQQCVVSSSGANIFSNYIVPQLVLEALDGFFFTLNTKGDVEFVSENVRNYLKFTCNELMHKNVDSMVHGDDVKQFNYYLSVLSSESCKRWSEADVQHRTKSFDCRLLVKPANGAGDSSTSQPQYNTMLMKVQPQPLTGEDASNLHDSNDQYYLACIAENKQFTSKVQTMKEGVELATKQHLDGVIFDIKPRECVYGLMKWFIGKKIREYCHKIDQRHIDKHFREVLSGGENTSGTYRLMIPSGEYVFVQSSSLLHRNERREPDHISTTHQIYRKCSGDELNGPAHTHLLINENLASIAMRSPVADDDSTTTDAALKFLTSTMNPVVSAVNGVHTVLSDTNSNGWSGTDQSMISPEQLNEFFAFLAEPDNVNETSAYQSSLDYELLTSGRSFDAVGSQPECPQFIPMPNIALSAEFQESATDNNGSQNPSDVGHSGVQLHNLLSATCRQSLNSIRSGPNFSNFNSELISFSPNSLPGRPQEAINPGFLSQLQQQQPPRSVGGNILRNTLLQPSPSSSHSDAVVSIQQSRESELVSPRMGSTPADDTNKSGDSTWKVPQQPDLTRRRRHPSSQLGSPSPGAAHSPQNIPWSPSLANRGTSPTPQQHIGGLKDLLLSNDSSSGSSDSDVRRTSSVGLPSSISFPFLPTQSVNAVVIPSPLNARQAFPSPMEVDGRQSNSTILTSLLLEPVSSDLPAEDNIVDNGSRSLIDIVGGGSALTAKYTATSPMQPSHTQLNSTLLSSPLIAAPAFSASAFGVSRMALLESHLTNAQQLPNLQVANNLRTVHSPLIAMAGLSSPIGNRVMSTTAGPSLSDMTAAVASRSMSSTVPSPPVVPSVLQGSLATTIPMKKNTNHLLRQLLEKNSPATQQQLLPKLIDDQSATREPVGCKADTVSVPTEQALASSGSSAFASVMSRDPDFSQACIPSKRSRIASDQQSDELKAKLTELWERGETADGLPKSPTVARAGTKRKSVGELPLSGSVFLSPAIRIDQPKQRNEMLSQMLSANTLPAAVMCTVAVTSVAVATPQMNMASIHSRGTVTTMKSASPIFSTSGQLQQSVDVLGTRSRFLSGGAGISASIGTAGTESLISTLKRSTPAATGQNSISTNNDSLTMFDGNDVEKYFGGDAQNETMETGSGMDVETFMMQFDEILETSSVYDIDSVLNSGVIPSVQAFETSDKHPMSKVAMSTGSVVTSAAAAEQREIGRIQSQLMRETANIQSAPPQQQKLLGLLLSEGSPACSGERQASMKDKSAVMHHGQSNAIPQGPNSHRMLLNTSGISRNASSVGSSLPPTSTNSLHSSDGVLAVVQRAEANAAARSAQLALSAANGLTRPMTPVSQPTTGFNQEWIEQMNVSFAPNISIERGPLGEIITTSVRQHATMNRPINMAPMSSSTSMATRPPMPSNVSTGSAVPGSPLVSSAPRLSFSGQPIPKSPLTPSMQTVPGSPLTSMGQMVPSSPKTPAGRQSMPNSPLPTVGQIVLPSTGAGQFQGPQLRVVMAPAVVNRQPATSSLVHPVLAAVLRPQVSGNQVSGNVQLVWNPPANQTFMTGGVLVQSDLLSGLTGARPTLSTAGDNNSVCVLGPANCVTGPATGPLAVRLISRPPTMTMSTFMPGLVRFLVTEPTRHSHPVQLINTRNTAPSVPSVFLSSMLSQQNNAPKIEQTSLPAEKPSTPLLVYANNRISSSYLPATTQQSESNVGFYTTTQPASVNSAVGDDVEGELPFDVLQSFFELDQEQEKVQSGDGRNPHPHQPLLSSVSVNCIENWLQQPTAVPQPMMHQQSAAVPRPSLKAANRSLTHTSNAICPPRYDQHFGLSESTNAVPATTDKAGRAAGSEQHRVMLAGQLNNEDLNFRPKSNNQNMLQQAGVRPRAQQLNSIQQNAYSRLPSPAASTVTDGPVRHNNELIRHQLLSSSPIGSVASDQSATATIRRSLSTSGGLMFNTVQQPLSHTTGLPVVRPARHSVSEMPHSPFGVGVAPQNCNNSVSRETVLNCVERLSAARGVASSQPAAAAMSGRSLSGLLQQPLASPQAASTAMTGSSSTDKEKARASQSLLQQLLSD